MPGPVADRTLFDEHMAQARAQAAVDFARTAATSSIPGKMLGYFTDNAAERAQREKDDKFAAIVGDHADYLRKALAADPKKIAAVQADPLSFVRSYGSQVIPGSDRLDKVAASDLPPSALPPTIRNGRQVATPDPAAAAAAAVAATMTPGQRSAQNQVDYITALRSNPAMRGMTFRDLAGYVGLQPQPAKPVVGKDYAIDNVASLIDQQYAEAAAAAKNLSQTDPQTAADKLLGAQRERMANYMKLTTPPDPVGEAVAAQQQK